MLETLHAAPDPHISTQNPNMQLVVKNHYCRSRFYCGDQDKLFKEAHLINPLAQSTMKKVQRSSRSSSASTSSTCCDICFQSPNLVSTVAGELTYVEESW